MVEPINKLIETVEFDATFYSLDWHPSDHVSFIDNIKQRPIHPTSPVSNFYTWKIKFCVEQKVIMIIYSSQKKLNLNWEGNFSHFCLNLLYLPPKRQNIVCRSIVIILNIHKKTILFEIRLWCDDVVDGGLWKLYKTGESSLRAPFSPLNLAGNSTSQGGDSKTILPAISYTQNVL